MRTKAVRLYGENDLRMEQFELPAIKEDEILAKIVSDGICMSSYKAAKQGAAHKRVPKDIGENPIIIGHEFCGELLEVGSKWSHKFSAGQKFTVQPAINYKGSLAAPGYSYKYIGGSATYVIIPNEVMETDSLLPFEGEAFFYGSLAEPMSCIVGTFHANYHTTPGCYKHEMGIVDGGCVAILAGAGPMGIGAIDYAIHRSRKPSMVVVTDIDDERLKRCAEILTVEKAKKNGVELVYVNTAAVEDGAKHLMELTHNKGYNDVFVFAPVKEVVEMGDKILAKDGCLNFFAGPTDPSFSALFNFYNVHYASTHIVGTSGGNTEDLKESLEMMGKNLINPAAMITHIGGLNAVADTTLKLPDLPGGKKMIYTHIEMPLVAIKDFEELGKTKEPFKRLAEITKRNNGLWSAEAERYLLGNKTKFS